MIDKYKLVEDVQKWVLGHSPVDTQLRLAQQDVLKYYKSAAKEWGPVISRFDTEAEQEEPNQELVLNRSVEDELADWLNKTKLDDDDEELERNYGHTNRSLSAFGNDIVELYTCAHCSNPSASLKKCARCAKVK